METSRTFYRFGWEWHPSIGGTLSINVGPYSDREEGNREFISYLALCGYTLPKWWEYWRWSERRLSKEERSVFIAALKEPEGEKA